MAFENPWHVPLTAAQADTLKQQLTARYHTTNKPTIKLSSAIDLTGRATGINRSVLVKPELDFGLIGTTRVCFPDRTKPQTVPALTVGLLERDVYVELGVRIVIRLPANTVQLWGEPAVKALYSDVYGQTTFDKEGYPRRKSPPATVRELLRRLRLLVPGVDITVLRTDGTDALGKDSLSRQALTPSS